MKNTMQRYGFLGYLQELCTKTIKNYVFL